MSSLRYCGKRSNSSSSVQIPYTIQVEENHTITIGRKGTSFEINDPYMSRIHATLSKVNNELLITDQQSSNGVFVNRIRIPSVTPVKLVKGDKIIFGGGRGWPIGQLASETEVKLKDDFTFEVIEEKEKQEMEEKKENSKSSPSSSIENNSLNNTLSSSTSLKIIPSLRQFHENSSEQDLTENLDIYLSNLTSKSKPNATTSESIGKQLPKSITPELFIPNEKHQQNATSSTSSSSLSVLNNKENSLSFTFIQDPHINTIMTNSKRKRIDNVDDIDKDQTSSNSNTLPPSSHSKRRHSPSYSSFSSSDQYRLLQSPHIQSSLVYPSTINDVSTTTDTYKYAPKYKPSNVLDIFWNDPTNDIHTPANTTPINIHPETNHLSSRVPPESTQNPQPISLLNDSDSSDIEDQEGKEEAEKGKEKNNLDIKQGSASSLLKISTARSSSTSSLMASSTNGDSQSPSEVMTDDGNGTVTQTLDYMESFASQQNVATSSNSMNENYGGNETILNSKPPPSSSSSSSSSKPILDIMQADLSCTICYELMVCPSSVSCGHSFCGPCLHEWMKKKVKLY